MATFASNSVMRERLSRIPVLSWGHGLLSPTGVTVKTSRIHSVVERHLAYRLVSRRHIPDFFVGINIDGGLVPIAFDTVDISATNRPGSNVVFEFLLARELRESFAPVTQIGFSIL